MEGTPGLEGGAGAARALARCSSASRLLLSVLEGSPGGAGVLVGLDGAQEDIGGDHDNVGDEEVTGEKEEEGTVNDDDQQGEEHGDDEQQGEEEQKKQGETRAQHDDDAQHKGGIQHNTQAESTMSTPPSSTPPSKPSTCIPTSTPPHPTAPHPTPVVHPTVAARLKSLCLQLDILRAERDRANSLWDKATAAQQAWQARCLSAEGALDELRQAELVLGVRVGELEQALASREHECEELRVWLGAVGGEVGGALGGNEGGNERGGNERGGEGRDEERSMSVVPWKGEGSECLTTGTRMEVHASTLVVQHKEDHDQHDEDHGSGALCALQDTSLQQAHTTTAHLATSIANTTTNLTDSTTTNLIDPTGNPSGMQGTVDSLHARLADAAVLGAALQHALGQETARVRELEGRLTEEHAARAEACALLEEVRGGGRWTSEDCSEGDYCIGCIGVGRGVGYRCFEGVWMGVLRVYMDLGMLWGCICSCVCSCVCVLETHWSFPWCLSVVHLHIISLHDLHTPTYNVYTPPG